ncbi:MAG: dienelactone hydrolase family protein [Magnetospirillum sp.]|nr:dienelactone hydrolase family protein [Magnetospirillum sp.]
MGRLIRTLLIVGLTAQSVAAEAFDPAEVKAAAMEARDLSLPTDPTPPEAMTVARMGLFKPEGDGPFPALVLFHQCAGLSPGGRPNASMLNWARLAVTRGYVVLLLDAFGPRGIDSVCLGPRNGMVFPRGVKDAFQAARHLRTLPYVQPDRVALAGYSWGAMVGLMASGKAWAEALGPDDRFRAVVSLYPGCFTIRPRFAESYETLPDDIDRPLLVLMGSADTETPPQACLDHLEPQQAAGAPVEWHLYPGTTHCWDCIQLDGFSKIDIRGSRVTYRYDEAVTRDAADRMFEFLGRAMR